ncbi:hypothetical protein Scep_002221 [Stephania cephalantha]|uniref:C2H2-type domain-containing protein n=1 Tax=Stephania cephalantha TaxID=152367 RepID=A0AAP0LAL5_9MAGN
MSSGYNSSESTVPNGLGAVEADLVQPYQYKLLMILDQNDDITLYGGTDAFEGDWFGEGLSKEFTLPELSSPYCVSYSFDDIALFFNESNFHPPNQDINQIDLGPMNFNISSPFQLPSSVDVTSTQTLSLARKIKGTENPCDKRNEGNLYVCTICKKSFSKTQALGGHKSSHSKKMRKDTVFTYLLKKPYNYVSSQVPNSSYSSNGFASIDCDNLVSIGTIDKKRKYSRSLNSIHKKMALVHIYQVADQGRRRSIITTEPSTSGFHNFCRERSVTLKHRHMLPRWSKLVTLFPTSSYRMNPSRRYFKSREHLKSLQMVLLLTRLGILVVDRVQIHSQARARRRYLAIYSEDIGLIAGFFAQLTDFTLLDGNLNTEIKLIIGYGDVGKRVTNFDHLGNMRLCLKVIIVTFCAHRPFYDGGCRVVNELARQGEDLRIPLSQRCTSISIFIRFWYFV